MRRRKLAAKILAVIMAVSACVSVNDSALIAMAAENIETEAVSAAEESTDEGSGDVDADSDDTAVLLTMDRRRKKLRLLTKSRQMMKN